MRNSYIKSSDRFMAFIACGINHKTASLAVREHLIFSPENTPETLHALLQSQAANEAVILSTCNRTEMYTHTHDPQRLNAWLAQHPQIGPMADSKHWYWHEDQQAVGHMMRVASGLDSMVLGESQILAQMKQALSLAENAGAVGTHLQRLLQKVFAVTKQVRTHTGLGANPVSVAYVAIQLAKRIFAHLENREVLLIGSGQTIELVALYLSNFGIKRLIFANRSLSKAQTLATEFQGHAIPLTDVPIYLQTADILFSATSSPLPILGKGTVQRVLKSGKRRPLFMVDLAVPRDIEPEVAEIEDVYLYNMDDLQKRVTENQESRQEAAQHAEEMIDIQARYFMRQLQALDAAETIRAYREKMERFRDQSLNKALTALQRGEAPDTALIELARTLTNKITHTPSVQMHQAGFDGQLELLLFARRLFGL